MWRGSSVLHYKIKAALFSDQLCSIRANTRIMATLLYSTLILWSSLIGLGLVSGGCLPSYTEIGGGCFLAIKDAVDIQGAREICQNNTGYLATVDDCALLGDLAAYLASPDVNIGDVWIGGTDVASEGTWRWTDGTAIPMGAPFWGRRNSLEFSMEPSGGVDENCAAMSVGAGYYFQDVDCDLSSGYAPLCQISPLDGPKVTCPSPYVSVGGACLEFLTSLDVSWGDARTVCHINGGDLAIIDDCHLMTAVIEYTQANALVPANGFWIGGSDAASEGRWTWIDGSSMAMGEPFWGLSGAGPLEPNNELDSEDCLTMGHDRYYYFNDYGCDYTAPAPLCQSDVI